jgi:hypothetical protein
VNRPIEVFEMVAVPFEPLATMEKVRRLPSGSVAPRVPVPDLSSNVVSDWLLATGGRFVAIITVMVAAFESRLRSFALKVNVSPPLAPALYELKQSPLSGDVATMQMAVDRTTDPQTLTDIAEEVMALGYAPRARAIIPAIFSRLDTLASGSNDPTLKSTARAIGMAWREWQEAHPSAAARLRDLRARRDRVEPEVADAFQNTRMRLGMR